MKYLISSLAMGLLASSTAFADPDVTPPPPIPAPDPATPDPMPPATPVAVPSTPTTGTEAPNDTYVATTGTLTADERPSAYAWGDRSFATKIGVNLTVGGGITGFTDKAMRDTVSSDVGGLWDFHAAFGTRTPVGIEFNYLGTAADVQSFANAKAGTLVGTTVEADLRYNLMPHGTFDPYIFAGMGWQRYDLTDTRLSQADSGITSKDDVAEFPMGVGLSFREAHHAGITADVRGTFRATTESTLVLNPDGSHPDLHTWEASAALGYEF